MRSTLVVLCMMLTGLMTAQLSFSESASPVTDGFRSGSMVVSIDMNGDTEDDLVRLNKGTELQVDLQHSGGNFLMTYKNSISVNPEWNIVAGDLNNDGWTDIVTSGIIDQVKVLEAIPFSYDYNQSEIADDLFFAQASNIVDANRDGLTDIFVCNDNGLNRLYLNDGTGEFVRDLSLIDFNTVPASDNSGNYGSVWTDFDMDGDLDLYIAKCRVGVFDPTDPRRINVLFVNTDTGFVEMADTMGLASGGQSWSTDFADIDNDGDLDIIVINHDIQSELFENVGNGQYVNIAEEAGLDIIGNTIQSIFRDFDNDGLVDLLITGSRSKLYRNLGDNKFEEFNDPFGGERVTSFTIGDFNNDGFPDVYTTYNDLYNTPSTIKDDKMWLNDGNRNNYVRIKAIGTKGSTSAIGAKLFLHGEWGVQMREIRAGESYGIGTSLTQNFGLGSKTSIDSLVVIWFDGTRESYEDIPVNVTLTVTEGACVSLVESLDQGPFVKCGGDTFAIVGPDGYASYVWSNGMTTQSIEVSETGMYNVTMTDASGCVTVTNSVIVMENTEDTEGEITVEGGNALCYGETVTLAAPVGLGYLWSTGEMRRRIEVSETGYYNVLVTRSCFDVKSDSILITIDDPNGFDVVNDTIFGGGEGELTALGDSISWYESLDDVLPVATGNAYTTPVVDTTTTFYAENLITVPGDSRAIGMTGHMGGPKYNSEEINLGLIFDVYDDFRLDSVMVYTDFPAERSIVLLDTSGAVINRATVQIDSGMQWVVLSFDIPVGEDYTLTTDPDINEAELGVKSPQLVRSETGVDFPYTVDFLASIKGADSGTRFYYYFYNWQVTRATKYCVSEKVPVDVVVVDTSTSVQILPLGSIRVYPNPTPDMINIELDWTINLGTDIEFTIRSIDGRRVNSGSWAPGDQISMRGLSAGIYSIELFGDGILATARIVVLGNH